MLQNNWSLPSRTVRSFSLSRLLFQARSLCTYGRARAYVLGIITFSTLYNLSRFWEVECVPDYSADYNMTLYAVQMTSLRQNKLYVNIYINLMYLLFIYVLPFSSLAVLNLAIYRQVIYQPFSVDINSTYSRGTTVRLAQKKAQNLVLSTRSS